MCHTHSGFTTLNEKGGGSDDEFQARCGPAEGGRGNGVAMASAWDGLLNTREITELPHYALNRSCPEDAYFTQRYVAEHCMKQFRKICKKNGISLRGIAYVEPSAGEGCFYDHLPHNAKKIALDINPKRKEFRKADYLKWPFPMEGRFAVIGNPPFGHRGALALAFINRSLLFADLVAFILPMSFYSNGKGTNMKRVQGATLIHSEKLGKESFYDPETQRPVAVNTVFQIWQKGRHKSHFADYDVSEFAEIYTCCSAPNRYCGLGRGRKYDAFITSTFYGNKVELVKTFEEVAYGSGYGIIAKKKKAEVMAALRRANWGKLASDATNSCKHIRMFHIRQALGKAGFGRRV